MVEFKVKELSERNYKEGDFVYVKFKVRTIKSVADEETWLQSEENEKSIWLTQDHVVHGDAYKFKDGDIVNYDGIKAKVIQGFDGIWYVLTEERALFDLNPSLIKTVITTNNVL